MPHFLFAYHGGKMLEIEAETDLDIAGQLLDSLPLTGAAS